MQRLSKRELLTEMSHQWRELGNDRPRGWRMQSLKKLETEISLITQP